MAAAVLLLPAVVAAAETDSDPHAIVREVVTDALEQLSNNREAIKQDPGLARALIERKAMPHTDMELMARFVLGRYWRDATPEQRQRFTRAFHAHIVQTYSHALSEYADRIVDFAREARIDYRTLRNDNGRALVRAAISTPEIDTVNIDLRMHRQDGVWKVFDVQVAGVSILLSYRANIAGELASEGLDGLIARLEKRTGISDGSRSAPDSHAPQDRDSRTALAQ
ncbi:MAG: ABC transporter substrate-binding protein [Ectothiorhodospiraceae bacterium]